jgi:hypothetical protein
MTRRPFGLRVVFDYSNGLPPARSSSPSKRPVCEAGQADSDRFFVQQYVKHGGHCAIQPDEIGRGLQQLRQWTAVGTKASRVFAILKS